MSDLSHFYGNDLRISASGDLLVAVGSDAGQQRVLRRLLTNPLDDAWNPSYGAGLPRDIGTPANAAQIAATIRMQLASEAVVAADPAPAVQVAAQPDGTVDARISYADAEAGTTQYLAFPLAGAF